MSQAIEQLLRQAWTARGWLSCSLWPLSLMMHGLGWLRRRLYAWRIFNTTRLPVPIIVVGNVMVGGVGKTPIVIALVQHLREQGWRVGVVARGYGRSAQAQQRQPVCEVTLHCSADDVGDEPLLVHQRCQVPVWVGAKRVDAAHALLAAHPQVQVIVSDDGLQHMAMSRDIELCVFDERGVGNGWLLPAGPLREPWPRQSATPEVPCFVVHTAPAAAGEAPQGFHLSRRLSDTAVQADGTQRPLHHWQHHPVHALAGIAKPQAFFDMLQAQGIQPRRALALPDHASTAQLCEAAASLGKTAPEALNPVQPGNQTRTQPKATPSDVLCTEKDAVKLWPHLPQVWAVPLAVTLPDALLLELETALQNAVQKKLEKPGA